MAQGYRGSSGEWYSLRSSIGIRAIFSFRGKFGKEEQYFSPYSKQTSEAMQKPEGTSCAYIHGANLEQWSAYSPKRSRLSGSIPSVPKAGRPMVRVIGHKPLLLPAEAYGHALQAFTCFVRHSWTVTPWAFKWWHLYRHVERPLYRSPGHLW